MQITQQLSDAALINAYMQGDEKSLETLIYRHKDKIYTTIYMLVKDKYLAEDIFQDTFLKAIRTMQAGKYSEQGKFLPWAVRVAHNLCMDHFRKARKTLPIVTQDGKDLLSILITNAQPPNMRMETQQVDTSVRKLIELLPEEQREVISLRIYGDLSFKEISNLTGVSINTALGRMRYALINLRKMISEQQLVLR